MSHSKIISEMTNREVLGAACADSPLAKVIRIFSEHSEAINYAIRQREPNSLIELRRLELHAANEILSLF